MCGRYNLLDSDSVRELLEGLELLDRPETLISCN